MYRYTAANGEERLAAWAETALDYNSWNYYCAVVDLYLYKDYPDGTSELIVQTGGSSCETSIPGDVYYGRAETDVPYDPNVEYRLEVSHYNEPIYIMPGSGAMEDYYNYAIYEDPMFGQVWYPLYFRFAGPGPSQPTLKEIILGATYAIWSAGALAGPPHHLKVVSDNTSTLNPPNGCSQQERRVRYRVVDSRGRSAGSNYIREVFPGPITDSCSYDPVGPSPCSNNYTDYRGVFTDVLRTGCPTIGGSCGFRINPNQWQWCHPGLPAVNLATLDYDVRFNGIYINGWNFWAAGTEFFP